MDDEKTIGSHQNVLNGKLCLFQQVPQNLWNRTRANWFWVNEGETLAVAIMTAIPKGHQAMPFFTVFLERMIYVGFHWAAGLPCACLPCVLGHCSGSWHAELSGYLSLRLALTQNSVGEKTTSLQGGKLDFF